MIRVESACHDRCGAPVVSKPSTSPVKLPDSVKALEKIQVYAVCLALFHAKGHVDGVARRVKGKGRAVNMEVIEVDLPVVFRFCRVFLCSIREFYKQVGIAQECMIDVHMLF